MTSKLAKFEAKKHIHAKRNSHLLAEKVAKEFFKSITNHTKPNAKYPRYPIQNNSVTKGKLTITIMFCIQHKKNVTFFHLATVTKVNQGFEHYTGPNFSLFLCGAFPLVGLTLRRDKLGISQHSNFSYKLFTSFNYQCCTANVSQIPLHYSLVCCEIPSLGLTLKKDKLGISKHCNLSYKLFRSNQVLSLRVQQSPFVRAIADNYNTQTKAKPKVPSQSKKKLFSPFQGAP